MRPVDTDALRAVGPSLGIGNPGTATQMVQFDDGILQQVLDVTPLVRRSRVPVGTTGLFIFEVELVHAAADSNREFRLNPYTLAQTGGGVTGGIYPNPVPDDMDVWVLNVSGRIEAGLAADFNSGMLDIITEPGINGFASGVAITNQGSPYLAAWNDTVNILQVDRLLQVGGIGIVPKIGMRVPRKAALRWRSRNQNAGALSVRYTTMIGLFSAGLGQDGVV